MGKSWVDIVINWDGDEIPLPKFFALWLTENRNATYRSLKSIEAHLIGYTLQITCSGFGEKLKHFKY